MQNRPQTDELIRLYHGEGMTLQQIGDRFGITRQVVHDRLTRAGVPLRPRSVRPAQIEHNLLYRLYVTDGLTVAETSAKLGITVDVVTNNLKRYGIPRRIRGPRPSLIS